MRKMKHDDESCEYFTPSRLSSAQAPFPKIPKNGILGEEDKNFLLHFNEKFYILVGREQDFNSPGNRRLFEQEEIAWNSFSSSVLVSLQLCKT